MKGPKGLWALRAGFFLGGLALVGIGTARGEAWEVMEKAVRICLECIGIG